MLNYYYLNLLIAASWNNVASPLYSRETTQQTKHIFNITHFFKRCVCTQCILEVPEPTPPSTDLLLLVSATARARPSTEMATESGELSATSGPLGSPLPPLHVYSPHLRDLEPSFRMYLGIRGVWEKIDKVHLVSAIALPYSNLPTNPF